MMFKMITDLIILPDSMCLDSGETICSYTDGDDKVEIEVRGYVTVDFNGERYRHYSDMPKELQELFKSGKAYDDDRVYILENNWYEIFFNWDEDYDVAEAVEGYNANELEEYCKECMNLFKTNRKENKI